MLTKQERILVADYSDEWTGPNTWGWLNGYRLSLWEAITHSEYG